MTLGSATMVVAGFDVETAAGAKNSMGDASVVSTLLGAIGRSAADEDPTTKRMNKAEMNAVFMAWFPFRNLADTVCFGRAISIALQQRVMFGEYRAAGNRTIARTCTTAAGG